MIFLNLFFLRPSIVGLFGFRSQHVARGKRKNNCNINISKIFDISVLFYFRTSTGFLIFGPGKPGMPPPGMGPPGMGPPGFDKGGYPPQDKGGKW